MQHPVGNTTRSRARSGPGITCLFPKGVKKGITLRVVGEEKILLFRMIIILHFGTK